MCIRLVNIRPWLDDTAIRRLILKKLLIKAFLFSGAVAAD